jgi:hypothetical protein
LEAATPGRQFTAVNRISPGDYPRGITGNAKTESAELQNLRALTVKYLAGKRKQTQVQIPVELCRNCGARGILVEGSRKSGTSRDRGWWLLTGG